MINVFADCLCANECGFDAAVADDFGGEGAEEGFALIGWFSEEWDFFTVAHFEGGGGLDGGGNGGGVGACDGG